MLLILYLMIITSVAGGKRKLVDQTDDQVNKHIHLDPESSDGFADLATLVNMSSAASLAVSQVRTHQKYKNRMCEN